MRANALEDNVVLYKVEGGKRLSLEPKDTPSKTYGVKHKVPNQAWSTLKVSFDGPRFEQLFDGAKIMEVEDGTFTAPRQERLMTSSFGLDGDGSVAADKAGNVYVTFPAARSHLKRTKSNLTFS
ncbi:MAG: hypothetical protein J0L64_21080 [Acidobacteria bacterium]|nr:hypothetical protein [Acidobacteriota bacterium]